MLKSILFFLYILLVSIPAKAQTYQDSLYSVWKDTSQLSSQRTLALLDYIYEVKSEIQPDSTFLLANELYRFSKEQNDVIGMIDALDFIGYTYFETGNYKAALENYQKALDLAKKNDDKRGMATILLKTGFIYHDNGELIKAIDLYQKSEAMYKELNDVDGLSSIYNEFGSLYRDQQDYEKALMFYEKSLEICEKGDQTNDCSAQYSNIGGLYFTQGHYLKARDYYQKSLEIVKKNNYKLGIASALSGLANTYYEEGNLIKSLELVQQSININQEIGHIMGLSKDYRDIAYIYIEKQNYLKAIQYCKKSIAMSVELGDLDDQMDACNCLYESYKTLGNTKKALQYLEQSNDLEDSLNVFSTAKKLQKIEFQKQITADSLAQIKKTLKLEKAHQIEVRKKDRNRNIAVSIGIIFLVLAVGFYGRWKLVTKSKAIIEKEKDRSENLLLNILPAEIAQELKIKGTADARDFDLASILFTDFKDFTKASEKLSAKELIAEINHCFKAFDLICEKYDIEKIKTIGDAYMAAGGLPKPSKESTKNTVLAALEMQAFISQRIKEKIAKNEVPFYMRLGVHTGPVVAGIVGVKKFQYDIWGDTVNTASRMESGGEISKVNISETTYRLLKDDTDFAFEFRGKIEVKGKGKISMYFVTRNNH